MISALYELVHLFLIYESTSRQGWPIELVGPGSNTTVTERKPDTCVFCGSDFGCFSCVLQTKMCSQFLPGLVDWKYKTGRGRTSRKCLRLQSPQACVVASRLHQLFVGTSLYDFSLVHVPESRPINDHPIVCGPKLRTL